MRFDVHTETDGSTRWSLKAADDRIVASSVSSFSTSAAAQRAAEDFRAEADTCDYDVWDNDGSWYWDANASNGKSIVTGSTAGFVSEARATLAYEDVRDNAGAAGGPDTPAAA